MRIEYKPEDKLKPVLRILPYGIVPENDPLYGLASISHMNDLFFVGGHRNHWWDIDYLKRYDILWLSVSREFYTEEVNFFKMLGEYPGEVFNKTVNPENINNDRYVLDFRVLYVKGKLFTLSESEVSMFPQTVFLDFASANNLDIGVIEGTSEKDFSINTFWRLGEDGSDIAVEETILLELRRVFGLSEYYNKVLNNHILSTTKYYSQTRNRDENYVDMSENPALIVVTPSSSFGEQLLALKQYKNLSSLNIITLDEETSLSDIDLQQYKSISFFVHEHYHYTHRVFLQKVQQEYAGKTVNFPGILNTDRGYFLTKWAEAGIPCPKFASGFEKTVPNLDEVTFANPYLIRGTFGHNGSSHAVMFHTKDYASKWPWWTWKGLYGDYIVEEFVDTSLNDGFFDVGRLVFIKDALLPVYVMRSKYWEVRPNWKTLELRSVGFNSFNLLLDKYRGGDFDDGLRNICSTSGLDIGALDFSITRDGELIPWDITANWLHGLIVNWIPESSETFSHIINEFMKLIENPLRITPKEGELVLEDATQESKVWMRPPAL